MVQQDNEIIFILHQLQLASKHKKHELQDGWVILRNNEYNKVKRIADCKVILLLSWTLCTE